MVFTRLKIPFPSCVLAWSSNQGIAFASVEGSLPLTSPMTLLPSLDSQVGPP